MVQRGWASDLVVSFTSFRGNKRPRTSQACRSLPDGRIVTRDLSSVAFEVRPQRLNGAIERVKRYLESGGYRT